MSVWDDFECPNRRNSTTQNTLTCTNTMLFVRVSRQSRPIWTLFSRRRHSPQAESRAAALPGADETGLVGGDDELGPVASTEAGQECGDVAAAGGPGDTELGLDLTVGQALGDEQ